MMQMAPDPIFINISRLPPVCQTPLSELMIRASFDSLVTVLVILSLICLIVAYARIQHYRFLEIMGFGFVIMGAFPMTNAIISVSQIGLIVVGFCIVVLALKNKPT